MLGGCKEYFGTTHIVYRRQTFVAQSAVEASKTFLKYTIGESVVYTEYECRKTITDCLSLTSCFARMLGVDNRFPDHIFEERLRNPTGLIFTI